MGVDYIPRRDAKFKLWAETFVNELLQNPARFAMMPAPANYLKTLLDSFAQAMAIATSEGTRTRPNILSKNNARHMLERICRVHARQIKDNLGVDDSDKIALGIRPINPARTPLHCPQTWPLLNIRGSTPGRQAITYTDSLTEERAKPFGASELQLFAALTDRKNAALAEARFVGKFTRNPIEMKFAEENDGKVVTYYSRWASERGETGPFSLPVSLRIAA